MPDAELVRLNLDVRSTVATVLGALPKLNALRSLMSELAGLNHASCARDACRSPENAILARRARRGAGIASRRRGGFHQKRDFVNRTSVPITRWNKAASSGSMALHQPSA